MVVPIFGLILAGWLLKAVGIFPERLVRLVNSYVYYVGITVITFVSLHDTNKDLLLDPDIYLLSLIPIVAIIVVAMTAAHMLKLNRISIPVFIICAFFGNTAYIGFPLNMAVAGKSSLGLTAFISSIYTVAVFTVGAYLFQHYAAGKPESGKPNQGKSYGLKSMLSGLLSIPVIWATILGLSLSWIAIPELIRTPLDWISMSTSPLALLATGAMITGYDFREKAKPLGAICAIKLAVMPAAVMIAAYTLSGGISGPVYRSSLLEAATPVGVTNAVLAEQFKADKKLASSAIVISTALFIISLAIVLMFV